MNLPIATDPCAIVKCNFEIRFDSKMPQGAIFGTIFNIVKDKYTDCIQTPLTQLPMELRCNRPELAYGPEYILSSSNSTIKMLIGPKIIGFEYERPYVSWEIFYQAIDEQLNVIYHNSDLDLKIKRFGLRYIDFFAHENILTDIFKSNISLSTEDVRNKKIELKIIDNSDGLFNSQTMIINSAELKYKGKNENSGSIYDFDLELKDPNLISSYDDILKYLQIAHNYQKAKYFSLIQEEYLKKLHPTYDNK